VVVVADEEVENTVEVVVVVTAVVEVGKWTLEPFRGSLARREGKPE
jgi:hypothetical protein